MISNDSYSIVGSWFERARWSVCYLCSQQTKF